MLSFPPPPVRRLRPPAPRRAAPPPPPPPAPPALALARFDPLSLVLTLEFDKAVDASGLDPTKIEVGEGEFAATLYRGSTPVTVASPVRLEMAVSVAGPYEGEGTVLDAPADTGIVSADGGLPWGGASGVALPFPARPAANVVATSFDATACTLTFDQPVWLNGGGAGGATPDDAMLFGGYPANSVSQADDYTLAFAVPVFVNPGSTWQIVRQPVWVGAILAAPQAGVF